MTYEKTEDIPLNDIWVELCAGDVEHTDGGGQIKHVKHHYTVGVSLRPVRSLGKSAPGISLKEYQELKVQVERYLNQFVAQINRHEELQNGNDRNTSNQGR